MNSRLKQFESLLNNSNVKSVKAYQPNG